MAHEGGQVGGLDKAGTGTFTLGGANNYSGATSVLTGTLATAGADVLPDASATRVASGATLQLGGNDSVATLLLNGTLQGSATLSATTYTLDGGNAVANLGAGRLINIKPGRVGGFAESLAIHDFCEANGIPVWCGGMLESGIGRAYNVALASLSNFQKPGDLSPSARYWAEDVVTPEWTMSADGMVTVPFDVPGIGVTVNVDRIDNLTVRTETVAR
jgi:O-succinylbenzoate synthase